MFILIVFETSFWFIWLIVFETFFNFVASNLVNCICLSKNFTLYFSSASTMSSCFLFDTACLQYYYMIRQKNLLSIYFVNLSQKIRVRSCKKKALKHENSYIACNMKKSSSSSRRFFIVMVIIDLKGFRKKLGVPSGS